MAVLRCSQMSTEVFVLVQLSLSTKSVISKALFWEHPLAIMHVVSVAILSFH